jgi:putative transposase
MPHSYVSCLMHCIFSTKGREKIITDEMQARLWPYIGGVARENKMTALAVGGVSDHCHVLLSIPATISVAKAIQLIKGGSSKWVNDTFAGTRNFRWQEGYGAFSIGVSGTKDTVRYIETQKRHHQKKSFEDEYRAILGKHWIPFDEKHVWG